MDGRNKINVLEPKLFDRDDRENGYERENGGAADLTDITRNSDGSIKPKLSQHISFLKAFFKSYKPEFTSEEIDTLAILLEQMYAQFGITNETDFSKFKATDYPILSDLYSFVESKKNELDNGKLDSSNSLKAIATQETLRKILLGIHSMAVGDTKHYFNGHTNIQSDKFVIFGVKDLLSADESLRNAMLFNALSYMGDMLLTRGNTMMVADEFHVFLSNLIAVKYIANYQRRVRKRDSEVLIATQNIEDFMHPTISHLTKPLISNSTHQFFFYPGAVNWAETSSFLQLEKSETELIKKPAQGRCLFRTGNERFHLLVIAPDYIAELFGSGGGRGAGRK